MARINYQQAMAIREVDSGDTTRMEAFMRWRKESSVVMDSDGALTTELVREAVLSRISVGSNLWLSVLSRFGGHEGICV